MDISTILNAFEKAAIEVGRPWTFTPNSLHKHTHSLKKMLKFRRRIENEFIKRDIELEKYQKNAMED